MPLTTSGFPHVETEATIPPANITHLPAINSSGGVHSLLKRPAIIFAAPIGVAVSTMSLTSYARPTDETTDPT